MTLHNSFPSEEAAAAALIAAGFEDNGRGYFSKISRPGGKGPRECVAVGRIVRSSFAWWEDKADSFTIKLA